MILPKNITDDWEVTKHHETGGQTEVQLELTFAYCPEIRTDELDIK